jgi:short-subunit dehydrogenase
VDDFVKRYGPWALIAGASEGIGAAFARALALRGVHLVLVARRSEPLEAARREIAALAPVEVRCVALDLARADAAEMLEQAVADLDVGLVVYNAALAPGGWFLDLPLETQLAAIDVNVRGPLALAHRFGRRLAARGRGGIVLLSSLTAFQG